MIGVVDYGMGNLRSILNSIEYLGFEVELVEEPSLLVSFERVILPGVGAYAKAMENIRSGGFLPAIREFATKQKPILGICLGMQILSTVGYEPHLSNGIDLIPGKVVPLPVSETTSLPHVGWNNVHLLRKHPLFDGVRKDVDFYFVHSYCFQAASSQYTLGITEYGIQFTSIVAHKNIVGLQFHPEKSQEAGLRILDNFCQWDGLC